jgi:transcription termination factor Rho
LRNLKEREYGGGAGSSLTERRIFPSINIALSGTRKEELLTTPMNMKRIVLLRRALKESRLSKEWKAFRQTPSKPGATSNFF